MSLYRWFVLKAYTYIGDEKITADDVDQLEDVITARGYIFDNTAMGWQILGISPSLQAHNVASFPSKDRAEQLLETLNTSIPFVIHHATISLRGYLLDHLGALPESDYTLYLSRERESENENDTSGAQLQELAWTLTGIMEKCDFQWEADVSFDIAMEAAARHYLKALIARGRPSEVDLNVIALGALTGDAFENLSQLDMVTANAPELLSLPDYLTRAMTKGAVRGSELVNLHHYHDFAVHALPENSDTKDDEIAKAKNIVSSFFALPEHTRFDINALILAADGLQNQADFDETDAKSYAI